MQRILFSLLVFFITGYFVASHFEQKIESDSNEVKIELAIEETETISSVDTQDEYVTCMTESYCMEDSPCGPFKSIIYTYNGLTSSSQLQNQKSISLFNNFTRIYTHSAYTRPKELLYVTEVEDTIDCSIVAAIVSNTSNLPCDLGVRPPIARARAPGCMILSMYIPKSIRDGTIT